MGNFYHSNGYQDACINMHTEDDNMPWQTKFPSKIIASVGSVLFGLLILFDVLIFVKYLVI